MIEPLRTNIQFVKIINKLPLQYQFLQILRIDEKINILNNDFMSPNAQTNHCVRQSFYKKISRLF